VSSSGISFGPTALIIAVLAYVLKRWWDNVDGLTKSRQEVYSKYYSATYSLTSVCIASFKQTNIEEIDDAYQLLQSVTPDFYLHASPIAMDMSDVFFSRYLLVREAAEQQVDASGADDIIRQFHESLNVLREVLKSEIFFSSPRFQYERMRRRRQWNKYIQDNKK